VIGRRVAITGLGVLSGYGRGTDALWSGLSSGRSAVREHQAHLGSKSWASYPMASLTDDIPALANALPHQKVVKHEKLRGDHDLIALADAVKQALGDAGLAYDPEHNDVGVVVTHESPGLGDHLQGFFRWGEIARAWMASNNRFRLAEFMFELKNPSVYRMHSFLYIHYLAALFQLHGFSMYNNNACASGAYSIAVAADRIRLGDARAMVVVGGDVPEDGTKYRWFHDLGLYSPSGACLPFSRKRDGLILGSGAAALVLEDLEQARTAGKRIYAELLGSGFTSEGWKITMPDVTSDRYAAAIATALKQAEVEASQIDLITPHGVGGGMLDHFEALTLAKIFPNDGHCWPPLLLGKAALGHTLGGCVLVETIASLLALEHGEVPAITRCVDPDPGISLGRMSDAALPAEWLMLKCTNGFAGQNGALVLRSVEQ
jgi:3-oxoacyl-(acyl-carrier-protein) synthase